MRPPKTIAGLPQGIDLTRADKGPFLLNVWRRLDGWEVRPGFGQIAKVSSSQAAFASDGGFKELLGSTAIETSFGTVQVLSVWKLSGLTATTLARSSTIDRYALVVHDADLRCSYDFVLHHQTSQRGDSAQPMPYWKPVYSTSRIKDLQGWQAESDSPRPFFCSVIGGTVLFGSKEIGAWAYRPSDFGVQGVSAVDGTAPQSSHRPDGEPACLVRVVPSPGALEDGFAYLGTDLFPSPVDACRVGARVCYIQGRSLYLSDSDAFGSIRGPNVVTLPTRGELVAVGEAGGSILAMTADETWLLRLPPNGLLDYADITQLSATIGCLGPQMKVQTDRQLVWIDREAVYAFDGGTDISNIGGQLDALFFDGLSNPLSSYYNADGATTLANRQPNSFVRWLDPATHLAFDTTNSAVFIVMPTYQSALCLSRGAWSLWTTDTQATTTPTAVKSDNMLRQPHFAGAAGRMFITAGPEPYSGTPISGSSPSDGAAVICEMGVGGAIDRTSAPELDQRILQGYHKAFFTTAEGAFVIGKPVLVRAGEKLGVTTATTDTLLYPVYCHPPTGVTAVDLVNLELTIDSNWNFATTGLGASTIDIIFPPERDKSRDGWGFAAPAAGSEIRSYSAGVPAAGGKDLVAGFDGNYVGIVETWTCQPWLIAAAESKVPMFWLPLLPPAADSTQTWTAVSVSSIRDQAAVTHSMAVFAWEQGWVHDRDTTDATAQPVDWAVSSGYKSSFDLGGKEIEWRMLRLRGAIVGILSHGDGTTVADNSLFGLMNATFGADWRDFSGQIADYLLANGVTRRDTVRARLGGISTALAKNLFEGDATWGSDGDSTGNELIADEQLDTLNVSSSRKGEGVQMMLFGHVRGVSQRVLIRSMDLVGEVAGTVKRWNR
jgi:hypothetical protein